MKYSAEILGDLLPTSKLKYGRRIGVYKIDGESKELIGEYERNYLSFFNTFCHFQKDGKDFALYSPYYSVTRIMTLPACEDIGGEEPNGLGFCPVDYFVPTHIEQEITSETIGSMGTNKRNVGKRLINNPGDEVLSESVNKRQFTNPNSEEKCETTTTYRPLTSILSYPFGFVAGCIWGDDSTYKIQYLDLSEAEKGIIKRNERFGYIELPENQTLKEAIDMYDFGDDPEMDYSTYIRINIMQTFDLRDGKVVNRFE